MNITAISDNRDTGERLGQLVPLGELAELVNDSYVPKEGDDLKYVALEHLDSGDPRLNRWASSDGVRSAKSRFRAGDVLYGKLRPYLDKSVIAEFDGVASTELLVLRTRPHTDAEYFAFLMHSPPVVARAKATTVGVNHPRTSWSALSDTPIELPPIDHQRQIANSLNRVLAGRVAITAKVVALKRLRRSVFTTLFQSLPAWRTTHLGNEVTLQRGYDLPAQARREGVVPVVSSSGVTGYHSESRVQGPGVIIGRYGTLGVVHYIEEDYWPLNTTLFVRDFHGNDARFVAFFLETLSYQQHSDKTSVPGINRNDLHAIEVLWPPLVRQREIAGILTTVDSAIRASVTEAQRVDDLFRSVLSLLFGSAA